MALDQVHLGHSFWRVRVSTDWNVLGPFPIHAREQHYLSPAFPLDLTKPVDYSQSWPSSYADGGRVFWSSAQSDDQGNLNISFPYIRWASLRSTEGWAALQHHAVLKTRLTIYPPNPPRPAPNLLIQLVQGSHFAVLPVHDDNVSISMPTPTWYQGNIYDLNHALPQPVELPIPPFSDRPTNYDLYISGDYEIRLFGDPRVKGSEMPVQKLKLTVGLEDRLETVVHEADQDVICDFVNGFAFGRTIGLGLRSVSGWWTVQGVKILHPTEASNFSFNAPVGFRIAPSQTRILPLNIVQVTPLLLSELGISITLRSGELSHEIFMSLPIRHLHSWDEINYNPIQATYNYVFSMPTPFIAIPPQFDNTGKNVSPILALHGAGVDIIQQSFWADALPRHGHSWVVIPIGRTSWGLDWHGPSARDAWACIKALVGILDNSDQWKVWSFQQDARAVVLGHSNGGQGTWYLASRYPDRVLGIAPAAAYIKSQAYVPLIMSRSAHFIDPMLRAILESGLTPDDNDVHLSNLVDTPIHAIHGGDDENVPVWHSREAISVLKTWSPSSDSSFQEDSGQGHWYPSVFQNEHVTNFLDRILLDEKVKVSNTFTLTVSVPAESGSLHGWAIQELNIPGRLGRLHINLSDSETAHVSTINVHLFTLDRSYLNASSFIIDGIPLSLTNNLIAKQEPIIKFKRVNSQNHKWEITAQSSLPPTQPSGRLQLILSPTSGPLTLIVPTKHKEQSSHVLSVASRLAHDLFLYHKLDTDILDEDEAFHRIERGNFPAGNAVIIGEPSTALVQHVLALQRTPFSIQKDKGGETQLTLNGMPVDSLTSAALFLHPHILPSNNNGTILFLLANTPKGFERALRLFPIRTGIGVPDWLIVGDESDSMGAAGIRAAGSWGRQWSWNEAASWSAIL
ncbi:hypothetical protein AMATHDRAFT_200381 [Amanita thiersii Skay4041]|uniref:Peptidase S9 prolyl oligopeptidase catalytic domain-containing protein n=1 Tax=Amanita thiersii Skay4041 TaxID=703135 RepID=A0A2A9NBM8_9AGAR|nr:hypothetical protein AMATHDRAFT_200381 [Amanita thiersii Skay4041]